MNKKDYMTRYHKETISSAAERLFLKKGLDKTTMDEVAREADYSKATLYVYFNSKEELFYYIVHKSMVLLQERIQGAVGRVNDPIEQYREVCSVLSEYCEEFPMYFECMLEIIETDREEQKQSSILDEIYDIGDQLLHVMENILNQGMLDGVFSGGLDINSACFIQFTSISRIVLTAHKKQQYIKRKMSLKKKEYLDTGYQMILQSVLV